MYTVIKKLEVSGAHQLSLDYPSKCKRLHGHNWIITITLKRKELDHNGMVCDFTKIKERIMREFDHTFVNEVIPDLNPTAENIARYICETTPYCTRVEVQESSGNVAIYELEEPNYD